MIKKRAKGTLSRKPALQEIALVNHPPIKSPADEPIPAVAP